MKKVGKNKFLSIFSIMVTMFCIIVAMSTFVFAYIPTLKFSATITQSITSCCYLQNNGITLFSTDSNHQVTTASVGEGKTYQVQPVGADLLQIKGEYQNLINSNKEIVFSVSSTTNNTIKLDAINVYGVDLPLPNSYMTATLDSTNTTLTIKFNSTLSIENYDLITCNLRFYQSNLPSGYTELEYIQSTGSQYIDTGFIPNQDTNIEITYSASSVGEGRAFVFGSGVGYNDRAYELYDWQGWESNYGKSNIFIDDMSINTNYLYKSEKTNFTLTNLVTGNVYVENHDSNSFTAPKSMYLFALNRNNVYLSPGSVTIYYCKIWDNNSLVRDYVPAMRNSDNEVGMYDLVSGTFYTNQGTGTFVAGPEVD